MGKYDKYEINWIKEPIDGRDWSWLESIFCKLGHYYDDYAKNVAEMPFNYTERTILGSLAIAADRCNYYTLLDYSTKTKEGYHYPDFWITIPQWSGKSYDFVFEAKRFKHSFETNNEKFKKSITKKLKDIHEDFLNKYEIGKAENAPLQCALLAFQLRIDEHEWKKFNNNNSYDKKWHELYSDLYSAQEKQNKDNNEWPDKESICSFWYLYWVPFDIIKNSKFEKWYWKTQETRPQYLKPALDLLIIGSFRKVK